MRARTSLIPVGMFLLLAGAAIAADQSSTTSGPAPGATTAAPVSNVPPASNGAPVITSAPGATEAQFGGDPNEIICRDDQTPTGSMFKHKVCHTRRDWAEGQDTARKMLSNMHHYQCGGDGCPLAGGH